MKLPKQNRSVRREYGMKRHAAAKCVVTAGVTPSNADCERACRLNRLSGDMSEEAFFDCLTGCRRN